MGQEQEIARRTALGLAAIQQKFAEEGDDEYCVRMFVEHHLEELEPEYWVKQTGTPTPTPQQVLDLIVLSRHWGSAEDEIAEDGINVFDFTLPEDATNYVIAVKFDAAGEIEEVDVES